MVSFSFIGRVLAGLCCIAFPVTAFFEISKALPLALYCILLTPCIGLIEIPACCSCFSWCTCVARYMKYVAGWWWVRGVIYVGLSAGGYAVYQVTDRDIYLLLVLIGLTAAALMFFIATFRNEENPAYKLLTKDKAAAAGAGASAGGGAGVGATAPAASGGAGIWGLFGARSKEEAVGKAVLAGASAAAANPSKGQMLFGGGGEDPESRPASGAYMPPKAETSATNAFATSGGGGLFGGRGGGSSSGGSKASKYGYGGDDLPESNPFVS